ncbi:MAG: TlpA disulfide reductase family protein [Thermoguttaceae bacterium]|jgi:hypothetical protein
MKFLSRLFYHLTIAILVLWIAADNALAQTENRVIKSVEEWERATLPEGSTSQPDKSEILAHFEKFQDAVGKLTSWEVRYRIIHNNKNGLKATYVVHLLSEGNRWLCERSVVNESDQRIESIKIFDGEVFQLIAPSRKSVYIRELDTQNAEKKDPRPRIFLGFLPFLENGDMDSYVSNGYALPDIRKIIAQEDTKPLSWQTRINDTSCSVLEQTKKLESPFFHSQEEMDAWLKKHPDSRLFRTVIPWAKAGYVRTDKFNVLIAIDPKYGWMPVRYAEGHEFTIPKIESEDGKRSVPGFEYAQFPIVDITRSDFRTFTEYGYVPGKLTFTNFDHPNQDGKSEISYKSEVILEDLQTNKDYPADFFSYLYSKDYNIIDVIRDISYMVGDPPELIHELKAAADARRKFYEELRKNPAPPLDASAWINGLPIRLEDLKGKRICIHFWSMGCANCVVELERFQEYQPRTKTDVVEIFVHQYVDGDDLDMLKRFIKNRKITFPVMVDAPVPGNLGPGKTFAAYRFYSYPTVEIDENGHFVRVDGDTMMNVENWWMKNYKQEQTQNHKTN